MTIQKASQRGGIVLIILIAIAAIFSGYGVNTIRFGGEMHRVNQQLHEFNADILPPPEYLVESYLIANLVVRSPRNVQQYSDKLASLKSEWRERADYWAKSDLDPSLKAGIANTVAEDGEAFWRVIDDRILPAARRGDVAAKKAALTQLDAIYERHRAKIDTLVAGAAKLQARLDEDASTAILATMTGLGLVGILVLSAISASLILLRHKIITPIVETADAMERIANGDLDAGQRSDHADNEIGSMTRALEVFRQNARETERSNAARQEVVSTLRERLMAMADGDLDNSIDVFFAEEFKGIRMDFNEALAALRELILSVVASTHEIRHGADEVSRAANDLSDRTARQAATLEETAAALQRTNKDVQSSSNLAQETNSEVAMTRQNAMQNREIVNQAVEAMRQIQASFSEVGNITNLIQDIAFQTNILALNAGVEATRAGEAGKGFGVVATEVRALAQRSSDAVKSIQDLMAQSAEKIDQGSQQVVASGDALREMIEMIDRVSGRVEELARVSIAQAQNLNEVDAALSDLERNTHQNAAVAEESSAASRMLNEEVGKLIARVAPFTQSQGIGAQNDGETLIDLRMAG